MIYTYYGRVSTDTEEQLKSIESQKEFFNNLFKEKGYRKPESGVIFRRNGTFEKTEGFYIDEGFSGAKSNKYRKAFQQMMSDARKKMFDKIHTKSISRFGRNTKEILAAIDELRGYGIAVYFEDLKIDTFDRSDDFKLTIFAAQAQEESRSKSESVQFGKNTKYKLLIWGGREPYGYNIVNGKLAKNDYEIGIVQRIFYLYLHDCLGLSRICKILDDDEVPTKNGAKFWRIDLISKILKNEIYLGVLRMHRTKKIDINSNLTKKIPLHEQIIKFDESLIVIDVETFKLVQIEKKKRFEEFGDFKYVKVTSENEEGKKIEKNVRQIERGLTRHSSEHLFSNILKCGNCGGSLRKKVQNNKNRTFHYWFCRNNDVNGKAACAYRNLVDEDELIVYVTEKIAEYKNDEISHNRSLEYLLKTNLEIDDIEGKIKIAESEVIELKNERDLNFKMFARKVIDESEYEERNIKVNSELIDKDTYHKRLLNLDNEVEETKIKFKQSIKYLKEFDSENLMNATLRKIVKKIVVTTPEDSTPFVRFSKKQFDTNNINIVWSFLGESDNKNFSDYVGKIADKYIL